MQQTVDGVRVCVGVGGWGGGVPADQWCETNPINQIQWSNRTNNAGAEE